MTEATPIEARASVPTESGSKYIQQLCKHWAHKLPVTFSQDTGTVTFDAGVATMVAQAHAIELTIAAESQEVVDRLKEVVARHLDRFAFREAPLTFEWS